jgi:hypothetical protein
VPQHMQMSQAFGDAYECGPSDDEAKEAEAETLATVLRLLALLVQTYKY